MSINSRCEVVLGASCLFQEADRPIVLEAQPGIEVAEVQDVLGEDHERNPRVMEQYRGLGDAVQVMIAEQEEELVAWSLSHEADAEVVRCPAGLGEVIATVSTEWVLL